MDRERDEQGRYTEQAPPESIVTLLEESDDPVLTATEIADILDISRDTARRKLMELHESDRVGRKTVGARAVVWWAKTP